LKNQGIFKLLSGSEPAAALKTGYLKPDLLTIYVDELQNDFFDKKQIA
jgi:hypothetical protein